MELNTKEDIIAEFEKLREENLRLSKKIDSLGGEEKPDDTTEEKEGEEVTEDPTEKELDEIEKMLF